MLNNNIQLESVIPYVTTVGKSKNHHIYTNSRGNKSISVVCPICGHSGGNEPCQISEVTSGGVYGLLMYCYKQHTPTEYKAAICELVRNVKAGNLPPPIPTQEVKQAHTFRDITENIVYTYCSADGTPAFFKNRIKFKDGEKSFPTYRVLDKIDKIPVNSGDLKKLVNAGLIVSKLGEAPLNLYDLHILTVTKDTDYLFIVEGEKCVEYMKALNFIATTTRAGANSFKLSDEEITAVKRFANIVVMADNDESGKDYYNKIKAVIPSAVLLSMTLLTDNPPIKYDIVNFMEENGIMHKDGKPLVTSTEITDMIKERIMLATDKAISAEKVLPVQNSNYLSNVTEEKFKKLKHLIPLHFTYMEQAAIMHQYFYNNIRYCTSTGWTVYIKTNENGAGFWDSTKDHKLHAKRIYAKLAEEQLNNWSDIIDTGYVEYFAKENLINITTPAQYNTALKKLNKNIVNLQNVSDKVLDEAAAKMEISIKKFDNNPYIINTPSGMIDLQTGNYIPSDIAKNYYCSMQTNKAPSSTGADIWKDFINDITCGDDELAGYMQLLAGEILIGTVKQEHLIIAYGPEGRNGKSTYFNVLFKVLGSYAFMIPAKLLCKSGKGLNTESYLAELKGRRMLLLPEMKRNEQLEDDVLKNLTSTDEIVGCKKFKAPFHFTPSHTAITYTNHLPHIQSDDGGTLRRLQVIPFKAKFPIDTAKQNYADELYKKAGESIMSWAIEGAKNFIAAGFKIIPPKAVIEATEGYFESNDSVQEFLDDECVTENNPKTASKLLYDKYLTWCEGKRRQKSPVTIFNSREFKKKMEAKGFTYKRLKTGMYCLGIGIITNMDTTNLDIEDVFG